MQIQVEERREDKHTCCKCDCDGNNVGKVAQWHAHARLPCLCDRRLLHCHAPSSQHQQRREGDRPCCECLEWQCQPRQCCCGHRLHDECEQGCASQRYVETEDFA